MLLSANFYLHFVINLPVFGCSTQFGNNFGRIDVILRCKVILDVAKWAKKGGRFKRLSHATFTALAERAEEGQTGTLAVHIEWAFVAPELGEGACLQFASLYYCMKRLGL